MNRAAVLICSAIFATSVWAQAPTSTTLKLGDMAPDFTLPSTAGKPVKLSDFKGKKNVVLAFFPAAFTGGCTKEMQAYQLGGTKFEANDTQVFGVSTDNTPSQKEFAKQLSLTFPLLSDFAERKVSKDYGVLKQEVGVDNRITFVIDKEGKITYMESGKVDIAGSDEACSRLAHRSTN
jgi:peroxiredoxin